MPRGGSETPEAQDVGNDLERLSIKLVRYALACQASGKPIRREGIRAQVLSGAGTTKFKPLMERANAMLKNDFGLEMVPLPVHEKTLVYGDNTQSTQQANAQAKAVNKWVLQNVLPDKARLKLDLEQDEDKDAIFGFAATVLSLIFVNNMSLPSDQLIMYVRRLGPPRCIWSSDTSRNVIEESRSDAQLDSAARESVAYLVNQGYIDRVTSSGGAGAGQGVMGDTQATQRASDLGDGDSGFEYVWGPSAKTQFQPMDMARFIAEMTDKECNADFVKTISRAYGRNITS
ncbi:hypothetical protein GGI15_001167 [Coemansia interrupta]|uniref:MAGE domain-containing protein n=1 Tax=Coemansia interrupta TaxID=1126814 RepID=A0A9W8HIK4_9FUNG|nr:hypothetical protein GGI15_001167 [Coemansia interrupta]